jgi:hypothetical protein
LNITDTSFCEYLKSISVDKVIDEIINKARDSQDSVLVDFKMSKGKMSGIGEFNTWVRFDTASGTLLKEILDKITSSQDPSKDEIDQFDSWRKQISDKIIYEHGDKIKEAVCAAVFSGNNSIPFKMLSAELEITDIPKNDKVVVVKKASPPGVVTPPVSSDIMRVHEETGASFEEIVNMRKSEGDPRYRWVVGVESRKSFYEINLSIAVDYSALEEGEKQK